MRPSASGRRALPWRLDKDGNSVFQSRQMTRWFFYFFYFFPCLLAEGTG